MARPVILYDSTCNFCNGWVDLLSRADKNNALSFVHLSSKEGQKLLNEYSLKNIDSVVLIDHGMAFIKSEAIIRAVRNIDSIAWAGRLISIFPEKFRNIIYNFIAKNRHRIAGKSRHVKRKG